MRKLFLNGLLFLCLALVADSLTLTSCATVNTNHCPGVSSTGNYASTHRTRKKACRGTTCAGTSSTGTIKPKVKRKKEDGLYSPKMLKAMEKSKNEGSAANQ